MLIWCRQIERPARCREDREHLMIRLTPEELAQMQAEREARALRSASRDGTRIVCDAASLSASLRGIVELSGLPHREISERIGLANPETFRKYLLKPTDRQFRAADPQRAWRIVAACLRSGGLGKALELVRRRLVRSRVSRSIFRFLIVAR